MMNGKWATSCMLTLAMVVSCGGVQLNNAVDAAAWIREDLSDRKPSVTFGDASDTVQVEFYAKGSGIPPAVAAGLSADVSVMAGVAVGDYSHVEGLSFRVTREGNTMAAVTVALTGTTGAVWNQHVTGQLSDNDGESCIVNVPLDPALWNYSGVTADYSARWTALWNRDIANVTEIKLIISHVGFKGETVSINNFRLIGEGFISDPVVLHLAQAHFDADISNSDELTAEQRAQDSDRDGRSDLAQLLAGEDPGLFLEIVGVDPQGQARLRWPGVNGRRYRIERTRDLTRPEAFESVPIENPVAERAGLMERTDTTAAIEDGPYFYRAVKE